MRRRRCCRRRSRHCRREGVSREVLWKYDFFSLSLLFVAKFGYTILIELWTRARVWSANLVYIVFVFV